MELMDVLTYHGSHKAPLRDPPWHELDHAFSIYALEGGHHGVAYGFEVEEYRYVVQVIRVLRSGWPAGRSVRKTAQI